MEDLEKRLSKLGYVLRHGVFYPKGYADIVFEDLESMEKAKALLFEAGWDSDNVIPFTGEEVIELHKKGVENRSAWIKAVTSVTSLLGGEDKFAEKNIKFAEEGKYFLLAYAGSEKKGNEIRDIVQPCNPLAIFGYAPLFIVEVKK